MQRLRCHHFCQRMVAAAVCCRPLRLPWAPPRQARPHWRWCSCNPYGCHLLLTSGESCKVFPHCGSGDLDIAPAKALAALRTSRACRATRGRWCQWQRCSSCASYSVGRLHCTPSILVEPPFEAGQTGLATVLNLGQRVELLSMQLLCGLALSFTAAKLLQLSQEGVHTPCRLPQPCLLPLPRQVLLLAQRVNGMPQPGHLRGPLRPLPRVTRAAPRA